MSVSVPRLAAFASPALPLAALGLPFTVHLPPYYAGELGLGLATVGFIFFLVRAIDLPLDPLLGVLIDRTRTPIGRFRPWFLAGAATLVVASYLVFMAPVGVTPFSAFWSVMLLYAGLSMFQVAHQSWAATLTEEYHGRSRVFGWLQTTGVLGMVLVLALPPIAAGLTGDRSPAAGVHAMGWFTIVLLPLAVLLTFASSGEPRRPGTRHHVRIRDMRTVGTNPLMRRLLVADVLSGVAPGIAGAMFIFVFEHRLGFSAAQASLLLLVYFIAGLLAAPLWMRLAVRIGKHRTATLAGVFYCLTQPSIVLLPEGNLWVVVAGMAIAGIPYAAFPFLMRAMLADVIDADRLTTGADQTGLYSAVLTTASKISHAVPIGVIYPYLAWIGFNGAAGAANTPTALMGMAYMFAFAPVVFMGAAALVTWGWRHDREAHERVHGALVATDVDAVPDQPSDQLGAAAAAAT